MEKEKYYMDCTNPECCFWLQIINPSEMCPVCGSQLEPAQVEDWNDDG